LQAAHLPLAEIRAYFRGTSTENVSLLAEDSQPEASQTANSAIDYINRLLRPAASPPAPPAGPLYVAEPQPVFLSRAMAEPEAAEALLPAPAPSGPPPPTKQSTEPDRAQWERIALDPDIEIHIRRPLTRQQNKRVERLISIARQLLEE
jgi:hypothetical protein